jgi:hypothetical protein
MLTKAQLCKKYQVDPQTFNDIRKHLDAQPIPKRGNVFYALTPGDEMALACARNHNHSFSSTKPHASMHVLPFHRFLSLRLITTPLDDILDELHYRHLVSDKLGKEYLKKTHGRFVNRLPKELRPVVRDLAEPPSDLEKAYSVMLEVLGIGAIYDDPIWLELYFDLVSDARVKDKVETIFTTHGEVGEQQRALEEQTGYCWQSTAIEIYKTMFYDINPMSDADWEYYLGQLRVSERQHKRAARDMTTTEFNVREGLKPSFRETMEVAQMNLQRAINNLYDISLDANTKKLATMLGIYTRLGGATGEEMKAQGDGAFFETANIVDAVPDFKTIDDIRTPKVARVKHG